MRAAKPLQSFLRLLPAALGLALLLLVTAAPARAHTYTYTFDAITSNNPANAAAGETQLRMDVTGIEGSATVTFTFSVVGTIPMSITDIYFYVGGGLPAIWGTSFAGFSYSPPWNGQSGVSFTLIANPFLLPGGQSYGLPWYSLVFSCDSGNPVVPKGINPGESLGLTFNLPSGSDVTTVVNALDGWLTDKKFDSGDLVVGLHVQAINNTGSESFVVGKLAAVSPVPLPGTALLVGSGLAALGLLARRRRREPPAGP